MPAATGICGLWTRQELAEGGIVWLPALGIRWDPPLWTATLGSKDTNLAFHGSLLLAFMVIFCWSAVILVRPQWVQDSQTTSDHATPVRAGRCRVRGGESTKSTNVRLHLAGINFYLNMWLQVKGKKGTKWKVQGQGAWCNSTG